MDEAVNRQMDAPLPSSTQSPFVVSPSHGGNQGLVLGFLIFLASATFVFGVSKVLGDVKGPFGWVAEKVTSSQEGQNSDDRLKNQDTDGDGLSDYEEYNVTKTSPFLKDTDGDGLDDKTEIASGHDPFCAQGENCFKDTLAKPDETGILPDSVAQVFANSPSAALSSGVAPKLSPDALRSLLSQNGLSGDILGKYSDDELQKLYQDSFTQSLTAAKQAANTAAPLTGGTTQPTTNPAVTTKKAPSNGNPFSTEAIQGLGIDPAKLSDPTQLTGEEIRAILDLSPDISADELNEYTDDQLRDILLNTARQEYTGVQP